MLVDIHCHLDHADFKNDIDQVINRASSVGVSTIITNGINPVTNRLTLALAKKYHKQGLRAALGIYPVEALAEEIKSLGESFDPGWRVEPFDVDEEIKFIEHQVKANNKTNKKLILAIGEIGLDNFSAKGTLDKQIPTFEKMLLLAKRVDLPVIIHTRNAEKEVIDLLETHQMRKVVLHCFTGPHKLVKKAQDLGYCFSIPSAVVRNPQFQQLVKTVNTSHLLTETDAPYMAIERGKRSEPADVAQSIKTVAEIKGLTEEDMKNVVYMNYQRIFG